MGLPPLPRAVGAEVRDDFPAIWDDFRATSHTLGPTAGVRERWHRGRRRFAVWLLPVTDAFVRAEVQRLQDALSRWIRPVRLSELHVTVWVLGFPTDAPTLDDDVDASALARSTERLQAVPPVAPRLSLGPVGSFGSAAILEARDDDGELQALRQRLLAGPAEQRFAPFRPHLTLGTYTADHPTPVVAEVLASLRDERRYPLRPDTLCRVELDAFEPAAPMQTVARVPLTSPETPCASS